MSSSDRLAAALLSLMFTSPAIPQQLHFGMKAGVPLATYFETGRTGARNLSAEYSAATRRYTIGVSAEYRITDAFGVELDALYHRMGYVAIVSRFNSSQGILETSAIDVKGNSWDFPLLVKYRIRLRARPFLAGGGVLRYVGPVRGRGEAAIQNLVTGATSRTTLDTTTPSELRKRFYPGLTVAAGVELGGRRLRLLPEFHYSHWTANISGPGGLLRFSPHQAEFLVGLRF